jgi:hypothetical protein
MQSGTGSEPYEYTQTEPDGESVGGTFYAMDWWVAAHGKWRVNLPCDVTAEADGVTNFVCTVEQTSDWHDAAGLSGATVMTFTLNSDQQLIWISNGGFAENEFAFNAHFHQWLAETHPDVYEQVNPQTPSSFPGYMRLPSSMTLALEYVDEFVAQSDDYPVSR